MASYLKVVRSKPKCQQGPNKVKEMCVLTLRAFVKCAKLFFFQDFMGHEAETKATIQPRWRVQN